MFDRPFDGQVQSSPGQMADNDFQRSDVDLGFVFGVKGMLTPEHLDDDPEELADGRHDLVAWVGYPIMPPIYWPRLDPGLSGLRQVDASSVRCF